MLINKEKTAEEKLVEAFNEVVKKKAEEYGYQRIVATPKDSKELEQLMNNLIGTVRMKDPVLALQTSKALAQIVNFWTLLLAESVTRENSLLLSQVNYQKAFIGLTNEVWKIDEFKEDFAGYNHNHPVQINKDNLSIADWFFDYALKNGNEFLEESKKDKH
jgi:hypothetical protein